MKKRTIRQAIPRKKTPPALADRLKRIGDGLNALIPRTRSESKLRALRARRREAFRQWEAAMRLGAKGATPEFTAAAKALQAASGEIAAAKKDLARIAKVIAATAEAAKLADRALDLALKAM
jgi:hypothetical protein